MKVLPAVAVLISLENEVDAADDAANSVACLSGVDCLGANVFASDVVDDHQPVSACDTMEGHLIPLPLPTKPGVSMDTRHSSRRKTHKSDKPKELNKQCLERQDLEKRAFSAISELQRIFHNAPPDGGIDQGCKPILRQLTLAANRRDASALSTIAAQLSDFCFAAALSLGF
jgi:hypothetical protein